MSRAYVIEKRQSLFRRRYRVVHTDQESGDKYAYGEFWTLRGARTWITARTWGPVTFERKA